MRMKTYYFTYGRSETQPFNSGWTEIVADSAREALRLFDAIHPPVNGIRPCAFVYDEDEFKQTEMYKSGNFGARCQERLVRTLPDPEIKKDSTVYKDDDIKAFVIEAIKEATKYSDIDNGIRIDSEAYDDKCDVSFIKDRFDEYTDPTSVQAAELRENYATFEDYLHERVYDDVFDLRIYSAVSNLFYNIKEKAEEKGEDFYDAFCAYAGEDEPDFSEWGFLDEHGFAGVDIDLADFIPEMKLNILLATKEEKNQDCASIRGMLRDVSDSFHQMYCDNALAYLVKQQGYDLEEILGIYKADKKSSNPFINSVVEELNSQTYDMGLLTVLTKASGKDALDLLNAIACNYGSITFPRNAMLGIFNEWNGSGSCLEIELDKDFIVPCNMVFETQFEGCGRNGVSYTVNDTYGLIGSCWKDGVSVSDTAVVLDPYFEPDRTGQGL